MARTDAIVLGAGIVGTSIALHLVKRGLSVALIDRAGLGEQTSYGNAGIIEGNTVFPPAFPSDPAALLRIAPARPIIICRFCRRFCPGCGRFAQPPAQIAWPKPRG
jgi:glycine/D-amino acid oxidase-like deaminating enzyme